MNHLITKSSFYAKWKVCIGYKFISTSICGKLNCMKDYSNCKAVRSSFSCSICWSSRGVRGGRGGPTLIGVIRFIAAFIVDTQPPVGEKMLLVTSSFSFSVTQLYSFLALFDCHLNPEYVFIFHQIFFSTSTKNILLLYDLLVHES